MAVSLWLARIAFGPAWKSINAFYGVIFCEAKLTDWNIFEPNRTNATKAISSQYSNMQSPNAIANRPIHFQFQSHFHRLTYLFIRLGWNFGFGFPLWTSLVRPERRRQKQSLCACFLLYFVFTALPLLDVFVFVVFTYFACFFFLYFIIIIVIVHILMFGVYPVEKLYWKIVNTISVTPKQNRTLPNLFQMDRSSLFSCSLCSTSEWRFSTTIFPQGTFAMLYGFICCALSARPKRHGKNVWVRGKSTTFSAYSAEAAGSSSRMFGASNTLCGVDEWKNQREEK